jgi:uncharacterized protein (UPF0332 family)
MKEIQSLVKRAQKYLNSADILLKAGDYESSVSRTYYAMFYSAQAMLLTKSLSFSSHKDVISAFGEHFVKTRAFPRQIGQELYRTFEKKQLGDYEHTFVISRNEAEQILENGTEFAEQVTQHLYDQEIL